MNDRIGVVWNPSKVDGEDLREALARAASAVDTAAPKVEWYETTADEPGQEQTRAAMEAGCTLVIAAGGDGTVRAVVEALTAEPGGPEFGIVPLGTGNLFARNIDIPLGDPEAAFQRALTGEARPIDLGELHLERDTGPERHVFTVMAGFGVDAQMIEETDDELKARAGWLAYLESLGRAFQNSEPVDMTVAIEGREPEPDRGHTMLIANCGTLQGGAVLLPDALIDDGLLDLMLLRAEGALDWLDTLRNLVWDNGILRKVQGDDGPAVSSESLHHRQTTDAAVTLAHPVAFEIDGEAIGEITGFTARVMPAALRVR